MRDNTPPTEGSANGGSQSPSRKMTNEPTTNGPSRNRSKGSDSKLARDGKIFQGFPAVSGRAEQNYEYMEDLSNPRHFPIVMKVFQKDVQKVRVVKLLPVNEENDAWAKRMVEYRDDTPEMGNKLLRLAKGPKRAWAIFEFIDGESTMQWFERMKKSDNRQIYKDRLVPQFMKLLILAIKTFHARGWTHLDIKLENVMIEDCENEEDRADNIGMVTIIDNDTIYAQGDEFLKVRGTHRYVPPEVYLGKPTLVSDMYSAGSMFYALLDGHFPFSSKIFNGATSIEVGSEATRNVARKLTEAGNSISFRGWDNPIAIDFCTSLLTSDVSKRMTTDEALAHPYLRDVQLHPDTEAKVGHLRNLRVNYPNRPNNSD